MPEGSLARRLSPTQCEHLAALGIELLELRPRDRPAAAESSRIAAAATSFRLRVCIAESARQAPLLQALVRALGLRAQDVAHASVSGLPTLAFAPDVDQGVNAPSLEQLRRASSKRALWPALRRLRRQLQSADRAE